MGFPGGPQSQERVFDMLTRATDNGAARQWCSGERCQHRDLRYIGKPRVGYSATKAAIIQLMKTTAVIYAAKGVRSNTVVSGLMVPPYTICIVSRYADSQAERYMEMRHVQVPMGKMGEAWDVVSVVKLRGDVEEIGKNIDVYVQHRWNKISALKFTVFLGDRQELCV